VSFFETYGEEIVWNRYSTPERIEKTFVAREAALVAREEQAVFEAERSAMRSAKEGDVISWRGSDVRRGATYSKVIMHSNLEYAGGAGDCSVESWVTLTPTDGAVAIKIRY
jgi:uncharacterized protein YndB with AHSA1/START domain